MNSSSFPFFPLPFYFSSIFKQLRPKIITYAEKGRCLWWESGEVRAQEGGPSERWPGVRSQNLDSVKGVSTCKSEPALGIRAWRRRGGCTGAAWFGCQSPSTVSKMSKWRVGLVWDIRAQAEKTMFFWETILKWRMSKIALSKVKQARKTLFKTMVIEGR